MALSVSAIVCTHNRSGLLKKALQSLLAQSLPAEEYEILVIDNASSDDTAGVVRSLGNRSNMKYVYEPKLGLSRARNAGVARARGRYVAFMDDDAVADPDWLKNILEAFRSAPANVACVGGKVELVWDTARPHWLGDGPQFFFSELEWTVRPQILRGDKYFLHGCNMAFLKEILSEAGGFDEGLGRKGESLLSGEDVAIQKILRGKGCQSLFDPGIRVRHAVLPQRLSMSWLMKRFAWEGISLAMIKIRQERLSSLARLYVAIKEFIKFVLLCRGLSFLCPAQNPFVIQQRCLAVQKMNYILRMLGVQSDSLFL
ncbi:MAG: glycosyltransferase family 2 protein [Candidatus Omnitrophota bacterium]|nr:glycosyltransferase family 2 protein [Candidatus Omnitrophota bacterium]MDZ4243409.1 glycosyltransferase family 2 protein [Candidatus Omnitrophota bacterium]